MKRYVSVMVLLVGSVVLRNAQAQGPDVPSAEKDIAVRIVLTKLDVNDTMLNLSWKITNNADHDVWICDTLRLSVPSFSECFLDRDAKTLMIRRQFSLPVEKIWEWPPYRARYVRLRPGQEKVESFSRGVPVEPTTVFRHLDANAPSAEHLAVEIGFYDEDLASLIVHVAEVAERIGCAIDTRVLDPNDREIAHRFFGGWYIAGALKFDTDLRKSATSGGDYVIMPHMGPVLNGEQKLRLTIENVSIPYKGS